MMTPTSCSKISTFVAVLVVAFCFGGMRAAGAESMPDGENGRYTLSPVTDGVIRLDTKTGGVSTCTNTGSGWACYMVPDERAALDAEIGRLQADNEKLKAELAARGATVTGKIDEPMPKTDSLKQPEPKVADSQRKIEIPLPSESDMDRVKSFFEQAWRRLVEMASQMQKDVAGKI
jgi:hypothetical protein